MNCCSFKVQFFSVLTFFASALIVQGQSGSPDSLGKVYVDWFNKSPLIDKVQGAEVSRAYQELLSGKQAKKKIIVAIIDSGVDTTHPDLSGRFWTNIDEIPGNGIDDDQNGYTDDIHGWGFLGNSKGENIKEENVEETRIYRQWDPVFKNVTNPANLDETAKKNFDLYMKARKAYEGGREKYVKTQEGIRRFEAKMESSREVIKKYLGKPDFTTDELKSIQSPNVQVKEAKSFILAMTKAGLTGKDFGKYKEQVRVRVEYSYNPDFQPRSMLGDNPADISNRNYGNNDVTGPRPDHGTPVSGIIAAIRNNGTGIDGIAENVELMVLRAVPEGDERDKDIALAIRYAVDNGANIINMSFGKNFSPEKEFIDEAIRYAEKHNVLMVHAAGNEAENLDMENRFPTNRLTDGSIAGNWITVGANSMKKDKNFCGVFSNYGQNMVDLFAPGVNIISLYPGNKVDLVDGTSFSGPVVTGVAALVWSYYPMLTAVELRDILLKSTIKYPQLKVYLPNITSDKKKKTKFSTLSSTGGIVNAYEALKMAESISGVGK